MSSAVFHLRRMRDGHDAGTVRVRADSVRAAQARVRRERPEYASDRLICFRIEEERAR